LLGQHEVTYYRCPACEFWFTEEPFWLDAAYIEAIDEVDQRLVQRNLGLARQLGVLLPRLFPEGPYVDWAGGIGLLVRLMRDAGFDYYWDDKYAANILAQGFSWHDNAPALGGEAKLVTAVEVLEHTPEPLAFLKTVLAETGAQAIFFTQCLHDGRSYDPNWWYLLPDSGQHISFFSEKTLRQLADMLGLSLSSVGTSHLLSKTPVNSRTFRRAMRISNLLTYVTRVPARMSFAPSSLSWQMTRARQPGGRAPI
jgi:2-polyprenyl-3-methyl-5-hydroxy-6-metoxy-1,4-benzoquinol methylase